MAKKWTCGICGGEVIEGQRFTFIGSLGAVHAECLSERIATKMSGDDRDSIALLSANEALLYTIIRLKEAGRIASSDDVKSLIADIRASIEKAAGRLSTALQKTLTSSEG